MSLTKQNQEKVVTFRTTHEVAERIKRVALLERRSDSQLIRVCVENSLPALEKKYAEELARMAAAEVAAIPEEEHERRAKAKRGRQ